MPSFSTLSLHAASWAVAGLWESLLLALIVALALRLAPGVPARVRFLLWTLTFAVLALLPFLPASRSNPHQRPAPGPPGISYAGNRLERVAIVPRFGSPSRPSALVSMLREAWRLLPDLAPRSTAAWTSSRSTQYRHTPRAGLRLCGRGTAQRHRIYRAASLDSGLAPGQNPAQPP